jgi:hypothetical protein
VSTPTNLDRSTGVAIESPSSFSCSWLVGSELSTPSIIIVVDLLLLLLLRRHLRRSTSHRRQLLEPFVLSSPQKRHKELLHLPEHISALVHPNDVAARPGPASSCHLQLHRHLSTSTCAWLNHNHAQSAPSSAIESAVPTIPHNASGRGRLVIERHNRYHELSYQQQQQQQQEESCHRKNHYTRSRSHPL